MTTDTRAELVATVERIGAQLQDARQDVALLQRLKAAEADAKRLALELRAAQDELAEAMTAEIEAQRDARFKGFLGITITEKVSENATSVLHRAFNITVQRAAFNGYESVPEELTFGGFQQLPGDALHYLIERHPERIPASIADLAPNDPYGAFVAYFSGLRRGYLSVRAA